MVDSIELKCERVKQRKSAKYMAHLIGKSTGAYYQKEKGAAAFTSDEIVAIANDMNFDIGKTNQIFFCNKLPNGNQEEA